MLLPIIARASEHPKRTAIMHGEQRYTYRHLLDESAKVADVLLGGRPSLAQQRVALMIGPGFDFVATLWGIWRAGGVAVPICLVHPAPAIAYTLSDAGVAMIVAEEAFEALLSPLAKEKDIALLTFEAIEDVDEYGELPGVDEQDLALLLYTSGTTSKPKGVGISHTNIMAQVTNLTHAWHWHPDDHILSVLPLHHVHGLINVVISALWNGAICEFLPKFEVALVWDRLCNGACNVFMAVPTIYKRLITYWETVPAELQEKISEELRRFRLMVSGSAALPVTVLKQWQEISGHVLLERYGMTEIGMALSNPYSQDLRRAGTVGQPIPGVWVRLVDQNNKVLPEGEVGEIQVKGPTVFSAYWQRPDATAEAFVQGWFKTGDIAVVENGYYRILGRNSVDIIKSGGYKISALEIEEVLRQHEGIQDCGVVALPDEEWGERVVAALVATQGATPMTLHALRDWAKQYLPAYKVPTAIAYVDELPRNVLGKVVKPTLQYQLAQSKEKL